MASEKHKLNSLIGKYLSKCIQENHPLDKIQIGLLEKTINELFGIQNRSPPTDVLQEFDKGTLFDVTHGYHTPPGKVINILKAYRRDNLGLEISRDLPLTDADAWSLYTLTEQEIRNTTYKALKEKYKLPKTYGFESFKVLHRYFIAMGMIDKDIELPLPDDF